MHYSALLKMVLKIVSTACGLILVQYSLDSYERGFSTKYIDILYQDLGKTSLLRVLLHYISPKELVMTREVDFTG